MSTMLTLHNFNPNYPKSFYKAPKSHLNLRHIRENKLKPVSTAVACVASVTRPNCWSKLTQVGPNCISVWQSSTQQSSPICFMYSIFTHIWLMFRANVGKYSMHGAYGSWSWIMWRFLKSWGYPICHPLFIGFSMKQSIRLLGIPLRKPQCVKHVVSWVSPQIIEQFLWFYKITVSVDEFPWNPPLGQLLCKNMEKLLEPPLQFVKKP